jgi:hypothetical protein
VYDTPPTKELLAATQLNKKHATTRKIKGVSALHEDDDEDIKRHNFLASDNEDDHESAPSKRKFSAIADNDDDDYDIATDTKINVDFKHFKIQLEEGARADQ